MIRIGIDLMGGDYAPLEAIKGVKQFLQTSAVKDACKVFLFGEESIALPILKDTLGSSMDKVVFIASDKSVSYEDSPAKVFREKPNSSIGMGYKMMGEGSIDSFISAGSTGAMLVGAQTILKPIKNISRLAIGAIMPNIEKHVFMLDVGSNVECKSDQLNQFSILGSVFMRAIHNIENPIVGLLNVGEEKNKGTAQYVEAHQLLANNRYINFIGNIEGRDILSSKVDVIVCDGFTGNVIIKLLESMYNELKKVLWLNPDGLNINGPVKDLLQTFNFENHGGTPILGINKPIIIGHGISSANAFTKMIESAYKLVISNFCDKLQQYFPS